MLPRVRQRLVDKLINEDTKCPRVSFHQVDRWITLLVVDNFRRQAEFVIRAPCEVNILDVVVVLHDSVPLEYNRRQALPPSMEHMPVESWEDISSSVQVTEEFTG